MALGSCGGGANLRPWQALITSLMLSTDQDGNQKAACLTLAFEILKKSAFVKWKDFHFKVVAGYYYSEQWRVKKG